MRHAHADQLALFDAVPIVETPIARESDPATSHEAGEELTAKGRRRAQTEAVYVALVQWPGLTSADLAKKAGMDRHLVAKRLPDLKAAGRAMTQGTAISLATNTRGMKWYATREGR